jgi:hypothetical protein
MERSARHRHRRRGPLARAGGQLKGRRDGPVVVDGTPLGEDQHPQLDFNRLQGIFAKYCGTIEQTLPPYSAKKVQGRPLYSYARNGIEVAPSTKTVAIKSFNLLNVNDSEAEFELSCSAGTYARSLAHDIGKDYNCGAHLVRLRRTRSGEFPIGMAVPLSEGEQFFPRDFFIGRIIPVMKKFSASGIQFIQASPQSSDPQGTILLLENRTYGIIAQAFGIKRIMHKMFEF